MTYKTKAEAVAGALAQLDNPNPPGSYRQKGIEKQVQNAKELAEAMKESRSQLLKGEAREMLTAAETVERFYSRGNRTD